MRRIHIFHRNIQKSTKSVEIKRNQIKNSDLDKIVGKIQKQLKHIIFALNRHKNIEQCENMFFLL